MRRRGLLLIFCAAMILLAGCTKIKTVPMETPPAEEQEAMQMVCIYGGVYRNTGKELAGEFIREEGVEITAAVSPQETPAEHGQSNFDCVGSVCVPFEDGFAVEIGTEWVYFEPCAGGSPRKISEQEAIDMVSAECGESYIHPKAEFHETKNRWEIHHRHENSNIQHIHYVTPDGKLLEQYDIGCG